MPDTAQAALPGLGFAEQCIARCRALFKRDAIRDPAQLGAFQYLWDCAFDERDRRFVLMLAGLPRELAARDWAELAGEHRAPIGARVFGLIQWLDRHQRALARLRQERHA